MTEEQTKWLKPGDLIRETYEVQEVTEKYVMLRYQSGANYGICYKNSTMAIQAELVQPAPTFDVGDTVRIVPDPLAREVYGNGMGKANLEGEVVKIICSLRAGDIQVETKEGEETWISIHCLALVKKAEKVKYRVQGAPFNWEVVEGTCIVASYDRCNHTNAEAAAKAECDRLNAEWRKKQEGKEGADHE